MTLPEHPHPLQVWIQAARPKTLWAAVSPVLIGTAMAFADGGLHLWSALAALTGAVLIQIGTNFHNDYADFEQGADTEDRKGPVRVTAAGLVEPSTMRAATYLVFGMAVFVGVYLIVRGGWPIAVLGGISIACGIWYTASSYSLASLGLADLFVLLFFGPVAVAGTYYVQTLQLPWMVLLAGMAPGLVSVALLTVNNLRDVKEDASTGKRTLPVRFGARAARYQYVGCLTGAFLVPVILSIARPTHAWSLVSLATLILAVPAIRTVFSYDNPRELNRVLAQTGRLLLAFSIVFSVGWNL